ncbi:MAG: tRNA ((6)-L-threonylcarbamoyladenosine(37)-C(2))-methylthiotransferase MtaB [Haloplasmataceae bacterium]|jgi:threonylcarbamoyladenosine tRNA methylthiotransferase MtaB|nr:tRNA ((6)-L-threonylcarbamoyladenosine(37)-C(2))-methylthiotransferase MtaB [Haloplasmataceae bacterium]
MIYLPTIAFYTLGCKVNNYETEALNELFKNAGYQRVTFEEIADVYVINTCTVTNNGDRKSRQMIRRAIRKNPEAVICVTGCYAQTKPNEIAQIEGVDIIVGTNGRENIVEMVKEFIENRKPITYVLDIFKDAKFENLAVINYESRTRANIKIQEGCQNFCTFCIIPFARGKMRSKDRDSVITEIQNLVDHGHLEIILTGIHTGGYGIDFENYDLADLIVDIEANIKGIKRLRISSIEISQINEKMLHVMKNSKILANHLHVPIQAGSNTVLQRMNRKYSTDEYYAKIEEIRAIFPDMAFTTDVVVGFPGETEEEFKETYEFIKKVGFSELHVFPYSKRTGTVAARMKNQVSDIIKSMRVNELLSLSNELALKYINQFKGKVLDVIYEDYTDNKMFIIGHASNYVKVKSEASDIFLGKELKTVIKEAAYPISVGEIMKEI